MRLRNVLRNFGSGVICLLAMSSVALADDASGADLYRSICSSCHGVEGKGVPGAFPPLDDHLAEILADERGAEYLGSVVLFGLKGPIKVGEITYNGEMPAWKAKTDEELATILNYVAQEFVGKAQSIVHADDIEEWREADLSPEAVHELRLNLRGLEAGEGRNLEDSGEVLSESGFYTNSQADAGASVYKRVCASCHGSELLGDVNTPPLKGEFFLEYWSGKPVGQLYGYAQNNMPPSNPGSLSADEYMNVVAHILRENDHPAGAVALDSDDSERLQLLEIGAY